MKLYCRDGLVVATHNDGQNIPASAYGDGVRVVVVPDGTQLPRVGPDPTAGERDRRPFGIPDVTADIAAATARAECASRINAALPVTGQMNMLAWAALVGAKTVSARSESEKADLLAYGEAVAWIADMRAAWPVIAADGLDPASDANWPVLGAPATELAGRF